MRFLLKRVGLILYGILTIIEGIVNTVLYLTLLDTVLGAVDWAFPAYFKYTDRLLKNGYLTNMRKTHHGKDI